jgi:hypothetical protein
VFNPLATGPVFGMQKNGDKTFSSGHSTLVVLELELWSIGNLCTFLPGKLAEYFF